jgi:voltage-gated potassium channel
VSRLRVYTGCNPTVDTTRAVCSVPRAQSNVAAAALRRPVVVIVALLTGSLAGVNPRAIRTQRRLEWPVLVAALLVIPAIAIELSALGEPWDTIAYVLNWATWVVFLAEVVIMLVVVDDRWDWVRHHPLDVAIVVLTPPVVPASLQAARAFRLLRLLTLLKAATLARRLFSTEGLRDAALLALLVVLGGGAAFASVEKRQHLSSWDGVWWALTTVSTVGYGDISPDTDGGRVIAIVVMLVGIGFIALITAAAADRFVSQRREADRAAEAERHELLSAIQEVGGRLERLERRLTP